jgi:tRNA-dihydrouridine synthase
MYKGEADWTLIAKVKENPRMQIPIFGNGDIDSPQKALEYKNKYGVDGIMIGRAAIGAPWIFNQVKAYLFEGKIMEEPPIEDKIATVKKHLQKSIEWKGKTLGILEMRPHYSNYLKGLPNIKPYRTRLVMTNEITEIYSILDEVLSEYSGFELIA